MYHHHDEIFSKLFMTCVDRDLLNGTIVALYGPRAEMRDQDLLDMYLTDPAVAAISPNSFFDEQWYRLRNPEIRADIENGRLISAFVHYINAGIFEGRWPNSFMQSIALPDTKAPPRLDTIDAEAYLAVNAQARNFLRHFPILTPLAHYNAFGRFLGMTIAHPAQPSDIDQLNKNRHYFEVMSEEFDAAWYTKEYIGDDADERFLEDPLSHYLLYGIPRGYSPSAVFDEGFYRAFYPEIREAIEQGNVPCGFYHYIVGGRQEGRLPAYDRKNSLEAWAPGVTRPVLLDRIDQIRTRLQPRKITFGNNATPRIWVMLPTINPDITFGGYRSVLELIRRLHELGYAITIICTEDGQANKAYFLWRESSENFRKILHEIDVIGSADARAITIGGSDTIVVYSLWDLYAADHIRKRVPSVRIVLLAQEFEPIFYENSTARAIIEEAYRIPHYPLINSNFLRRYFESHRIGVFGGNTAAIRDRDYSIFEHRINKLNEQTESQIKNRNERVLITYARPENHAARNMFELLILALRQVCSEGLFGPEWRFIGLGALTEIEPVPIGGAHKLMMYPKMNEQEYIRYISAMDIGVSLMYAPHPSVMPFEFATTGALVVTNSYENRSAEELSAISGNIIAGRPTIEGIAGALREAISCVSDAKSRIANIYRPRAAGWNEIFHEDLINTVFGFSAPQKSKNRNASRTRRTTLAS